nr:retrovirus-related Pol polyprotein from transposon TNT 1-94 [Tanacetum cinerariifolium]
MVNAMFLSPGLSHGIWGKAIISVTYLLDKIYCKENKIVLMNYGRKEDYFISSYKYGGYLAKIFVLNPKEIGKSSRMDEKVVQDQRQRDNYDLQDERHDQPKEEEIFKKKRKADGTVDNYKARLVIKWFGQREGLDYFDTYSLVTRITSIRMILAIAVLKNLEVHQIDVKKAFLNGDLKEEIHMNQPEGFMAFGLESKLCRLVKSLYDLRKAPNKDIKFHHIIKARLKFEEDSRHSESGTPSRRRNLNERLGPRRARSMFGSPEPRHGHSKSPREKDPERKTVFKSLEKGVFHRLGDKERDVSAHSRNSRHRSYYSSRRDTKSCYQISRSRETEIASKKHRHKRESSRRTEALSESADGHWKSKPKKQKSSVEDDLSQPWESVPRKLPPTKKCIKDSVEIHDIKQRDEESTEEFVRRKPGKSKTSRWEVVKRKQEKDKIGTKPDKNGKRSEARQ